MELVVVFTTKLIKFYCKNFGKDAYKEKKFTFMFKYNLDQSCIYYFSTKYYAIRIFVTRFSAVSLY